MKGKEHDQPFDGVDPFSAAVIDGGIKKVVGEWAARSDLVRATYPDQEAMKASDMADDIFDRITDGENFPGIDCDLIRDREKHIPDSYPKMLRIAADREEVKIDKMVSRQTGVSLKRIKKASEFWVDNVL